MAKITMPSKKPSVWKKLTGEISALRDTFSGMTLGSIGKGYKLDTSKVDYELTRGLYHNSLEKYKLGAGFARPIIATTVGFMGTPRWASEDEDAQIVLDEHMERLRAQLQKVNRNTLRDGDCFTRIYRKPIEQAVLYKTEKPQIDLQILPPGSVNPVLDAETGRVSGYEVITNVTYTQDGKELSYDIIEVLSADEFVKYYKGNDVPEALKNITESNPQVEPNKWGFTPIIHWLNESEEDELYGRSDLEPVEPFMKAYHDVMLNSLKNNKMHAAPKLKLKINDVASFLKNNFGVDVNALKPGEKPSINFSGSDIIIMPHNDDEVEFVQATSTMSDSGTLLKFLFYCIIDVSQTPEFAFGTAMQSSKASVKEQMTPLIKKVESKREMMEQDYKLLARMILCVYEKASIGLEKMSFENYETKLEWDVVVDRDLVTESAAINAYVTAFNAAITGGIMSVETAVDFLEKLIPNMATFDDSEDSEQERIERGMEFLDRLGKSPEAIKAEEEAKLFDEESSADDKGEGKVPGEDDDDL